MAGKAPGYAQHADYRLTLEPCAKRLRVVFGGETIADTTAARLCHETRHLPVYYFPRADVRMDLLTPTARQTHCPFKGDASYWTIAAGGRNAADAVWSYDDPYDEASAFADHMAFYWDRMDAWFEEDEEVFVHARDPYARIDVVASTRPVRVVAGGEVLAATARALFLFETGLPVRYYIPREDVRMDRLTATEKTTRCPYKGTATYWSLAGGDPAFEDIVWSYPDPLAEVGRIKDYLCVFNERADEITIDGEAVARPVTQWS